MKVTSFIAKFLKKKNINIIFELQGGMITRIIDELYRQGDFNIISMHHEQAAAFAADAYARITNKPGVAIATSGPGAINLLTGIGSCFFDSVPAVFITGQVNIKEQKGDKLTRQIGFQETDIVSIAIPITKKAYAVKSASEIPFIFEEAFYLAQEGRPGPVIIDIPMNIQNEEIDDKDSSINIIRKEKEIDYNFFDQLLNDLKLSKRPLILAGRGISASGCQSTFLNFLKKYKVPVVSSLLGLDAINYQNPLRIGFIGTYGNRWANYALGKCDLLIILGSRVDIRQTGIDTDAFAEGKKIFHIDIDSSELNNRVKNCFTLEADLADFFSILLKSNNNYEVPADWLIEIDKMRSLRFDTSELMNIKGINPNIFMHKLSQASIAAGGYISDVGNNQMWSSQSLEIGQNQFYLTSGGMGAMGYSLPAAIGASLSVQKPVVSISGDGGFQINIQELQTIKRNNLPIKIIIINNHCLGMIRQFQDSYFDSRYQSTVWGYDAPDFTSLGQAYGIDSYSIISPEEIDIGLKKLWENPNRPFLLEVKIDIHTNVLPKMMFGRPLTELEPEIK
jgi:acetolactate synthase-1/2/3 large subunit